MSAHSSGPPQGGTGVPSGAGASPPTATRPYGIDISTAGTFQEKYFIVLAGLLEKNLAVSIEIRDALVTLNKNLDARRTDIHIDAATADPESATRAIRDSLRQGKKVQR